MKKGDYLTDYEQLVHDKIVIDRVREENFLDSQDLGKREHAYLVRLLHAFRKRVAYEMRWFDRLQAEDKRAMALIRIGRQIYIADLVIDYEIIRNDICYNFIAADVHLAFRGYRLCKYGDDEFSLKYYDVKNVRLQRCELDMKNIPDISVKWKEKSSLVRLIPISVAERDTLFGLLQAGVVGKPLFADLYRYLEEIYGIEMNKPIDVSIAGELPNE